MEHPQDERQDPEGIKKKDQAAIQVLTQCKNKDSCYQHPGSSSHHSYRVKDIKLDEMQGLDKMTRNYLCMNQMHARKTDADRTYLSYQEGSRGQMDVDKLYKAMIV